MTGQVRRARRAAGRVAGLRAGLVEGAGQWLLRRWRRSLQLRVAATTMVACGLVVLLVGIALMHQITQGVLENKVRAAEAETRGGLTLANSQLGQLSPSDQDAPSPTNYSLGFATVPASVPEAVQRAVRDGGLTWAYSELVLANNSRIKGLVFGGPVHVGPRTLELYYLFPLSAEDDTIALIQRIVLFAGLGLVLLVALISVLITQQVVGPVRLAARTAERLAAGRLEERMQ